MFEDYVAEGKTAKKAAVSAVAEEHWLSEGIDAAVARVAP